MATQILPYEPSPSEKRKQWIAENVFGSMDDRYRANRLSQGIVDTIDMIPGYGDIEGIREGYHLATEGGSPYIGTGIAALGALPFVPGSVTRQGTDFLREQAAKLRVTPTQYTVEKTDPLSAAVAEDIERTIYSDRDGTEVPPAFESMASEPPQIPTGGSNPQSWYNRTRAELATEGRPFTIETMAERSIVNNKDYQNPYKKYNVQGLIQSTLQSVDAPARANLERQFDEWIPQEMKEGKATLQEVLDEIGRNKPKIHQQVDARPNTQLAQEEIEDGIRTNTTPFVEQMFVSPDRFLGAASYSRYMPSIPTDGPALTSIDAARFLMPLKYTEKNLSVHSPKYGRLFEDPGHQEVGSGASPTDFKNTTNRIFTTRSGVYEIEGQRVLIPAEGQSGIYKMTKDEDTVRRRMDAQIDPDDEADPVNIDEIRNRVLYNDLTVTEPHALSTDFLADVQPRLKEQFTLEDWKREVEDFRERSIDQQIQTLYNRNLTPAGTTGASKQEILAANKKVLRERMNQYDDALNKLEYENGEAIHAAEVAYNTEVASMEGSSLPLQGARERYERELRNINDDFNADKEALDDQYANEREATTDLRLVQADIANIASNELHAMLNPLPSSPDKPTPLLKDWFPMHMKMSMNDAAVDPRIDAVRFPINDYAMQKQMGHDTSPARLRMFSNEFDDMPDPDNPDVVGQTINTVPRENAQKLGEIYEKETKDGIKRIEAEYGIKLNGTVVEDDNLNQFLEIQMTPEIREAFQKVLMNKGGEVNKDHLFHQRRSRFNLGGPVSLNNRPLMPLQYGQAQPDLLDRGVQAYEELPILAQIAAGETPAGLAADLASAAKYGRDAVRAVVAGRYGEAATPAVMAALSAASAIPAVGAVGTLGKNLIKESGRADQYTKNLEDIGMDLDTPMYHGTGNPDITEFVPGGVPGSSYFGSGHPTGKIGTWMSDSTEMASDFSTQYGISKGSSPNVMPLYRKTENPLVFWNRPMKMAEGMLDILKNKMLNFPESKMYGPDGNLSEDYKKAVQAYEDQRLRMIKQDPFRQFLEYIGYNEKTGLFRDGMNADEIRQWLLDKGYDSVEIRGTTWDAPEGRQRANQFLILKPENIKGKFSKGEVADTPEIMKAHGGAVNRPLMNLRY